MIVSLARRAAAVAAIALLACVSCASSTELCRPAGEGFGDATVLTQRLVEEIERPSGPCRPRVETVGSQDELRKVFSDLEQPDPPPIDFTSERVVVREGTREAAVRWVVARGDVITVGAQACVGTLPAGCLVEIYAVKTTALRAEQYTCAQIRCGGVASDPAGAD